MTTFPVNETGLTSLHIGRLKQQMTGLERQIGQLSDEIVSLALLPDASSFSGPRAIEELALSLSAEILRLKSELDACEHDLQLHRIKATQQQENGQSPYSDDSASC